MKKPDSTDARAAALAAAIAAGPRRGDAVLTVRQPWAYALVTGVKRFECRTWTTTHRGPLWIHAAARATDTAGAAQLVVYCRVPEDEVAELPLSAVVGVVHIDAVYTAAELPRWAWSDPMTGDAYNWFAGACAALPEPVPMSGKLGLWKIK